MFSKATRIGCALGAVLTVCAANAFGQPEHSCEAPEKPEKFENQEELDGFMDEARGYMDLPQSVLSRSRRKQANLRLKRRMRHVRKWKNMPPR